MRKVLKRPQCQVEMTPVIRPGRYIAKVIKVVKRLGVSMGVIVTQKIERYSLNRQARRRIIYRGERNPPRSPPSGSTLHTPT